MFMTPLQKQLRHAFTYDPSEPFALRWRIVPWRSRVRIGDIAGYWHPLRAKSPVLQRFVEVKPSRRRIALTRAVWIYHRGETNVPHSIDFKDGNKSDFRIENLIDKVPLYKKHGSDGKAYRARFSDEEWKRLCARNAMRHHHGITPKQYDEILQAQGGVCAICRQPETQMRLGEVDRLAIDHCHTTKRIRGLLCAQCNNGIGRFNDDPVCLRAAADYLERHRPDVPRLARIQPPTSSGHRHIYWDEGPGKWRVRMRISGQKRSIGSFALLTDAIAARDAQASSPAEAA